MTRRSFISTTTAAAAAAATGLGAAELDGKKVKLGFDNFSLRAFGWKAEQLLKYAAEQKADALLISDLKSYESLETSHLKDIGKLARELGVELHAGTLSICPTSVRFSNEFGTAEEHLKLLIRVAHDLGSTVGRCVLGFGEDRKSPGGIQARIADTVKALKGVKGFAQDHGVKLAVENHAGDMQAWELKQLIEQAGPEFVGATIDSGNATWTIEDPLGNLEILAPHVLTSGIRDSMLWEIPDGTSVQWTAMGEGVVDFKAYMKRWAELIPDKPVILEIISGFARPFPHARPEFWQGYEECRAAEFARFLSLAKRGKALPPFKPAEGGEAKASEQNYQKAELERSIKYCRETLGLGRK